VGIILILIALYGFSEYYKREDIFRNALIGLILAIVGIVVVMFVILVIALGVIGIKPIWGHVPATTESPALLPIAGILGLLVGLIVLFAIMIVSAVFFRKSLHSLAEASGENLIEIAGTLYLVGAILVIVVIGIFLIYVSYLVLGIGFFMLKEKKPPEEEMYKPYEVT